MKYNTFRFKKDGLYIDNTKISAWNDLKIESDAELGKTKLTISIYGNLHGVDDLEPYDFAKPDK
ncbi:hypothetical protein FC35_GL000510 [Limosilactobacillus coleohominis DSM 14060]|nr:hypothetical protein FC35_GL000510 [Limosilactobacillus coleohominis DSM 14060]